MYTFIDDTVLFPELLEEKVNYIVLTNNIGRKAKNYFFFAFFPISYNSNFNSQISETILIVGNYN